MLRKPYYCPPALSPTPFALLGYEMPYLVTQGGQSLLLIGPLCVALGLDTSQQQAIKADLYLSSAAEQHLLRLPGGLTSRYLSLPVAVVLHHWLPRTPATATQHAQVQQVLRHHFPLEAYLVSEEATR